MKNVTGNKHLVLKTAIVVLVAVIGISLGYVGVGWINSYNVEKVYFDKGEYDLYEGQTVDVTAKTDPFGAKVAYSSNNENVAAVSGNGRITALSQGEAVITAFHKKSGKRATVRVVVMRSKLILNLTVSALDLDVGETYKLQTVSSFSGSEEKPQLKFRSEDTSVAEVSDDGEISAVGRGETTVVVYNEEYGVSKEVSVKVRPLLEKLSFAEGFAEIAVGERYVPQLELFPDGVRDTQVELKTSNDLVAAIVGDGVVGKASGDAFVTATNKSSGKSTTMLVRVVRPAASVRVDKTAVSLYEDQYAEVNAEVFPENADNTDVLWTSSDEGVAKVNVVAKGKARIEGVSEGKCTVRAASADTPGVYAEIEVTVSKRQVTKPPQQTENISKETYINGILVVNKTYGLPKNYNEGGGLTAETAAAFEEMKKAAAKDGISLRIASGYRSYNHQKRLFEGYLTRRGQSREYVETYSARPGHSEHQAGVAIDVNMASDAFLGTPAQKWLDKHCVEYGFIIRYPEGKQQYTGFKYEPWHVRYLGKENAEKVSSSGLCLEEYLGITSEYAD